MSKRHPRPGEDGYPEFYAKRKRLNSEPKICKVCGREYYQEAWRPRDGVCGSMACVEKVRHQTVTT